METTKLTRQSLRGVEYQIEYKPAAPRVQTEYRVRRGSNGTWTRWISTLNIHNVLQHLGFCDRIQLGLVHDFAFESILGRGEIVLPTDVVTTITRNLKLNPLSVHVYSRLKRAGDNEWILPSSAITNRGVFDYVRRIIYNYDHLQRKNS